jgi:hypothetical protein
MRARTLLFLLGLISVVSAQAPRQDSAPTLPTGPKVFPEIFQDKAALEQYRINLEGYNSNPETFRQKVEDNRASQNVQMDEYRGLIANYQKAVGDYSAGIVSYSYANRLIDAKKDIQGQKQALFASPVEESGGTAEYRAQDVKGFLQQSKETLLGTLKRPELQVWRHMWTMFFRRQTTFR